MVSFAGRKCLSGVMCEYPERQVDNVVAGGQVKMRLVM